LPLSIALFALALYSYFPARLFIPLFALSLCCVYFRFFLRHKRETLLSAVALIMLLIPFVENLFAPGGFARWQQVSIFAHAPEGEPIWQHIATNYLSHFSLGFLFTLGDSGMPGQAVLRHSVRGMGELYLLQLPLVLLGLYTVVRGRSREGLVLLLWLLLYPVGSMFTTDANAQATRSIIGVVPWQILSAVGLVYLFQLGGRLVSYVNGHGVGKLAAVDRRIWSMLAGGVVAAAMLV